MPLRLRFRPIPNIPIVEVARRYRSEVSYPLNKILRKLADSNRPKLTVTVADQDMNSLSLDHNVLQNLIPFLDKSSNLNLGACSVGFFALTRATLLLQCILSDSRVEVVHMLQRAPQLVNLSGAISFKGHRLIAIKPYQLAVLLGKEDICDIIKSYFPCDSAIDMAIEQISMLETRPECMRVLGSNESWTLQHFLEMKQQLIDQKPENVLIVMPSSQGQSSTAEVENPIEDIFSFDLSCNSRM